MHYKTEPFKLQHLHRLKPRPEQQDDYDFIKTNDASLNYFQARGLTLLNGENTVAILALIDLGFGSYMPLLLTSSEAIKHKLTLVKFMYEYFEKYVGPEVRRIEALIDVDDKTALRFVKFFGFDIIGIKHCSSRTGGDQIIVERLVRKPW